MQPRINPIVDCVFKALFGSEQNNNLLVHFLNAVLGPTDNIQVRDVVVTNPFDEEAFVSDKLNFVDIVAHDVRGNRFHLESSLSIFGALRRRIEYNWHSLHTWRFTEGGDYDRGWPVYSVWVLADVLFGETDVYRHRFAPCDETHALSLAESGSIHVIELPKWRQGTTFTELDRWMRFFQDWETLDDEALPEYLDTPEMRQAMATLRHFAERERARHIYRKRLEYLREQRATGRN